MIDEVSTDLSLNTAFTLGSTLFLLCFLKVIRKLLPSLITCCPCKMSVNLEPLCFVSWLHKRVHNGGDKHVGKRKPFFFGKLSTCAGKSGKFGGKQESIICHPYLLIDNNVLIFPKFDQFKIGLTCHGKVMAEPEKQEYLAIVQSKSIRSTKKRQVSLMRRLYSNRSRILNSSNHHKGYINTREASWLAYIVPNPKLTT